MRVDDCITILEHTYSNSKIIYVYVQKLISKQITLGKVKTTCKLCGWVISNLALERNVKILLMKTMENVKFGPSATKVKTNRNEDVLAEIIQHWIKMFN